MKTGDEEAIETLQMMIDAECLMVGDMESPGEEDIDRGPLQSLAYAITAIRERALIETAWRKAKVATEISYALGTLFDCGDDTALKKLAGEK